MLGLVGTQPWGIFRFGRWEGRVGVMSCVLVVGRQILWVASTAGEQSVVIS